MASFDLEFYSNVKAEKVNAIKIYQRHRKLKDLLGLFNLCAALFMFSRSSLLPIVVESFYRFFRELVVCVNNPFYMFVIGNAIILFVYALSVRNNDSVSGVEQDVHDHFVNDSKSHRKINDDDESPAENEVEQDVYDESSRKINADGGSDDTKGESNPGKKIQLIFPEISESSEMVDTSILKSFPSEQIVLSENPALDKTVTAVTETTTTCSTVSTSCNGKKVSEQKCYRRVQSESYEGRRTAVKPGPELNRLNTVVCRELVRYGGELERRLCSVEELSNEEFNQTVENFIAKQKRMLWEEQKGFNKTETERLALTQ
ncbi:tRNA-methyltransferase non-catalytic subunit trm6MTase subunit [Quillaja saponaria]|uniref:tRNA-methyltransferase non-catalytic subunit trm6MTase subunit n=1 Tax=Quillaja saponaria TaxID=32244 RepID=A0AAD7LGI1_QUISA|nr:tRNA-methyltransferase non-catalytic subunit trm6MTase subunit [Quillaja saponaria]